MKDIKISEFLQKEYREFARYVVEFRAIPSIIDGFKPTQRKIIYVAEKYLRNNSNKVATLAGKVISDSQYHHGNVPCEEAIVNMAQEFKNNLPLFEKIGQFGSLHSQDASAARYISVRMSKAFDLVYKDQELLEYRTEEDVKVEPYFYLPIIPMVLVNGGSGIAIGFATNILNRDAKTVVKDCLAYLNKEPLSRLVPKIDTFSGSFTVDKDIPKKWYMSGKFNVENATTVKINELPPSVSYDRFESLLDELEEKKAISSWENHGKGTINYLVKFPKETLSKLKKPALDKLLKLTEDSTENFTVLDEHGKLKIFDTVEDILKYFVDFRLGYYHKRKDYLLEKIKMDIIKLTNKALFIKAVIDGKIIVNNKKKEDIIKQIEKVNIEKFNYSYDYLLSMPIYSLSKEQYEKLLNDIKDKKIEEKEIKKSDPKQIYMLELEELGKKLGKI